MSNQNTFTHLKLNAITRQIFDNYALLECDQVIFVTAVIDIFEKNSKITFDYARTIILKTISPHFMATSLISMRYQDILRSFR